MNAYLGGDPPAAWEATPPELLAIVHFYDSEPGPVETLTLGSRVLPGDGVIDLQGYAAALRELRYTGPLSVELFNERLWRMPPEKVTRRAMESLRPFVS
jgi:sugar phosphate isomerase/epimerase